MIVWSKIVRIIQRFLYIILLFLCIIYIIFLYIIFIYYTEHYTEVFLSENNKYTGLLTLRENVLKWIQSPTQNSYHYKETRNWNISKIRKYPQQKD